MARKEGFDGTNAEKFLSLGDKEYLLSHGDDDCGEKVKERESDPRDLSFFVQKIK